VGNFNFYGSYQAADIVKKILGDDEGDGLHIVECYIDDLDSSEMIALAKFSKHTLLHGFILDCLWMWFSEETRSFKKNGTILLGSFYELDTMLNKYQIEHTELDITEESEVDSPCEINSDILLDWIEENYESFNQLWQKIAD
jgi:hypothetical protein